MKSSPGIGQHGSGTFLKRPPPGLREDRAMRRTAPVTIVRMLVSQRGISQSPRPVGAGAVSSSTQGELNVRGNGWKGMRPGSRITFGVIEPTRVRLTQRLAFIPHSQKRLVKLSAWTWNQCYGFLQNLHPKLSIAATPRRGHSGGDYPLSASSPWLRRRSLFPGCGSLGEIYGGCACLK